MSTLNQPAPVSEGEVIDEKYRVDRVLGVGGMGIVVAATHVHLEQRVALKFLLPAALSHPEVVARFAREARSAVKIQSQHVAKVLDVGTLSTGAPYMVMEYLEGEDLEQLLARVGPLPLTDAVDYVLQACEAVAEAHGYGIVHRDLKPANLFLAARTNGRPIVKVLDFGISKSLSKSEVSLTRTSAIMGSPLYMSPEQMASARHADVRSDVWALGVILYQVLTQRQPFQADSMPELVVAVLHRAPDSLRAIRPDVPPGLEAAVLRCLEKEPAARFADVAALATALAPYGRENSHELVDRISHSLDRRSSASFSSTVATGPKASTPASARESNAPSPALSSFTVASWTHGGTPPPQSAHRAVPSRRSLAWIGVPALLLGAVVAGIFALRRPSHPPEDASRRASSASPSPSSASDASSAPVPSPRGGAPEPPTTGQEPASPYVATTTPTVAPSPPASAGAARPPRPTVRPGASPAPSSPPAAPRPAAPKSNPLDLKLQF